MSRIKELEQKILSARKEYYNGSSQVSDQVYDAWINELSELDPKNIAVTNIGYPVINSEWKKASHKIPMGSLDKVNTPEEMKEWTSKIENALTLISKD